MIAVRTLASSSTQGLKMCNDPSETFLTLWHVHKGFFRACDTKGTKEPCPLQLQDLAIFFFMQHSVYFPRVRAVSGATDAADESWVLQQGDLLHAKYKLESWLIITGLPAHLRRFWAFSRNKHSSWKCNGRYLLSVQSETLGIMKTALWKHSCEPCSLSGASYSANTSYKHVCCSKQKDTNGNKRHGVT